MNIADAGRTARVTGAFGFGLEVPDLEEAERFYKTLGMTVRDHGAELALGCHGREQDEIVVCAGPRKRLHHVAFSIAPGALDAFAGHLAARDIPCSETAPPGGRRDGLWFRDPWQTWICLVPSLQAPVRAEPEPPASNMHGRRQRVGEFAYEQLDRAGRPLRFQHVLLFAPDIDTEERWFVDTLGFGVSDRQRGRVSFLYAASGDCWDHHCFALVGNAARGLHHCSFEYADFDQLGFCLQRMREQGYTGGFGPGRQFLGSNVFAYIRDPWGSYAEISTDMDQIDAAVETRDWEAIPRLWGPEWAADFWTANGEAAT